MLGQSYWDNVATIRHGAMMLMCHIDMGNDLLCSYEMMFKIRYAYQYRYGY